MLGTEHQPLRLVLDTNVVVVGLLWNGPPRRLLELSTSGNIELFTSPVLIQELTSTLQYQKFESRIQSFKTSLAALVLQYSTLSTIVLPSTVPRVVLDDSDDDHVIAAAVAARASLIITGDRRHLLPVGSHQGIAIITASEALERIATLPRG